MKPGFAMPALLVAAAFAAAPASTTAAITTQQGAMCKPYGMNYYGTFFATSLELENGSSGAGEVLCPVVRVQEVGPGGFKVYVDGTMNAGATTTCWLMSDDYSGNLIGSTVAVINGPSTFDQLLVLPQSQVPMWSSQVVDCILPSGGAILDIEPLYD